MDGETVTTAQVYFWHRTDDRLLNPDYLAWMMEGEQQSNAPLIDPEYFQWMLENNKKPRGDYDGFL